MGTITAAGLTASPLARWLGVGGTTASGILVVGAHRWSRALADALKRAGLSVYLVDSNWSNVTERNPGSSTLVEIDAALVVGPIDPAINRGRSGLIRLN